MGRWGKLVLGLDFDIISCWRSCLTFTSGSIFYVNLNFVYGSSDCGWIITSGVLIVKLRRVIPHLDRKCWQICQLGMFVLGEVWASFKCYPTWKRVWCLNAWFTSWAFHYLCSSKLHGWWGLVPTITLKILRKFKDIFSVFALKFLKL